MAKVEFIRIENIEDLENIDIKDGQLIYIKNGKTFMDYGNERIPTGSGGSDIVIGTEEDVTEDTKILIETAEIKNKGSEVVDSLQGNEIDKAPSVRAINNIFNVTVDEQLVGKYFDKDRYRKVFEVEVTNASGTISVPVSGSTRIVNVVGKIYWNNYSGFTKFPYYTSDNDKASLYSLNSTVYSQYSFGSASSRIFQLEVYYTKD